MSLDYGKVYGPYTRKDKRQHVIVMDKNRGKYITVSYPKYLMELRLGRRLLKNETVDHIDENKENNTEENFQILTRAENAKKWKDARPSKVLNFICPICHIKFKLAECIYRANQLVQKKSGPYCSKSCAGKVGIYKTTNPK